MKICTRCGKERDESMFNHNSNNPGGIDYICKNCNKIANMKYKYGITVDVYVGMYNKQGGKCAICGRHQSELSQALYIDHDHKTGKIRGLLCAKCNSTLGKFGDDIAGVKRFLDYLETNADD